MHYDETMSVFGSDISSQDTVLDFWKWAFGDLQDDDIKGIFAEWLLFKILQIPSKRRISWANSDITTPCGVRVEVKSSAYWQSWKLLDEFGRPKQDVSISTPPKNESEIRFSGLKARDAVETNQESETRYKSDVYIFCFQNEADFGKWNALNLEQWEFYVFTVEELNTFAGKSVSLKKLREKQTALKANDLKLTFEQVLESLKNA